MALSGKVDCTTPSHPIVEEDPRGILGLSVFLRQVSLFYCDICGILKSTSGTNGSLQNTSESQRAMI